jgi:hypothetical protein
MPKRYVLRDGLRIRVRAWGDENALWDNGSGDTHLVDGQSFRVLLRIAQHPQSAGEGGMPFDTNTLEDAELDRIVEELLRVNLIELSDR